MSKASTRRHFLSTAPLAAAAAVAFPIVETGSAQAQTAPTEKFKLITAAEIDQQVKALHAAPGNYNLFDTPKIPVLGVLTVEDKKSGKEYEWHEGRDHLFYVLEGSTVIETGGTPQNGRNTKPGEWLAPNAEGSTRVTLHKGDWLLIPRNTLHRRITENSVTFILISPTGLVA